MYLGALKEVSVFKCKHYIGDKKSSQGSLSPVGIFFYVRKHTYKEHKRLS